MIKVEVLERERRSLWIGVFAVSFDFKGCVCRWCSDGGDSSDV